MRSRSEIDILLRQPGIIAVVRAEKADHMLPLAEALISGGVIAIEITMTTPKALEVISTMRSHLGTRALIGVGTVLNATVCAAALAAGAEFVVSPILRPEIVDATHAVDRLVLLGAYTPTEAQMAYEAGADFVKIFPADGLGPNYIKALRAPLPHLRVVPTGGIDLSNIAAFMRAGSAAVGVGSSLISPRILEEANWAELTAKAKHFVAAVHLQEEERLR
jgi:2-dehydro-3-deoxyphosphogluconate aldolase/(4S)-4-hydroxy-2-oxoglutarate aldolase